MPHLTKIELDHETGFKAGLRDSYSWHQGIWKAFPNKDDKNRDFLTRLDEIDGGLRLLLLSPEAPPRPDWCPESCWHTKEVADSFWYHSRYRFSLVANPTKKAKVDKHGQPLPKRKRVPWTKREDLLAWLQRKGEQHGFTFDPDATKTTPRPRQHFIKKGAVGLHSATEFSGKLTVTDPDKFKHAALHGIGPAKAFGFGMLCLSPLNNLKSQI